MLRFQPIRESQQRDIQGRRRDRQVHLKTMSELPTRVRCSRSNTYQHQHVGRSFLFSTNGGHGRLGMRDRLWMSDYKRRTLAIDHYRSKVRHRDMLRMERTPEVRRVIRTGQSTKAMRLTIGRSCCRWPCLQIYLQSC